jgi:CO dehydrogenase/acetyl-CoA synthase beta subunit
MNFTFELYEGQGTLILKDNLIDNEADVLKRIIYNFLNYCQNLIVHLEQVQEISLGCRQVFTVIVKNAQNHHWKINFVGKSIKDIVVL